ncbi:hypothetical protein MSG28_011132 [Choristoneura fumiferana]|uniref:Uncharacterized protein n=1 Tax=Choristoneura fumiferana TaxID=7141 RepID=A0ACC0KQJ9_CHOFU|nr:hypothetical protein MSG28_011132 [Choristoneura fumiferana]
MSKKSVKFNEFNPQVDSWDNYLDRLKYCFIANGIDTDKDKKANFFTVCGAQVFETCLALITPSKTSDVTFGDIETVLTKHYSPKPNEISMSYKFYKRDQRQGEKASEYITDLRKISSSCNFSDLERMLRDRLVCGMSDHRLQYELLKKDGLTYQNVVDAMLSSESANHILDFMKYSDHWRGTSATIVPKENTSIWGAIWRVHNKDMAALDKQEGVDTNWYFPKTVEISTTEGNKVECRTYQQTINPPVRGDNDDIPVDRRPSITYLDCIIKGAIECKLPQDYIENLKKIQHNGQEASPKMIEKLKE